MSGMHKARPPTGHASSLSYLFLAAPPPRHRYVSGYSLNFEDFATGKLDTLCSDGRLTDTMFRIVVKSNLTLYLAQDLACKLDEVVPLLDRNASQKEGEHRAPSLRAMVYAAQAAGKLSFAHGRPKETILHGNRAAC